MDTGVMSGAPSPNNCEVRCNAELEEGKASPGAQMSLDYGEVEESDTSKQLLRGYLQGAYLTIAAGIIITCYYFHLFDPMSDLGVPSPLQCRSSFLRYNTEIGGMDCGLWGQECLPSNEWMPIRCPALCGYGLNDPIDTRVIGSSIYRADSRLCLAAWHAGFIKWGGGCVDVRITDGRSTFEAERKNGIDSLAFNSWFPFGLEFRESSGRFLIAASTQESVFLVHDHFAVVVLCSHFSHEQQVNWHVLRIFWSLRIFCLGRGSATVAGRTCKTHLSGYQQ